ncbi:hypothetical protein MMC06_003679 [Schaereria dolodes]|nr:hypothetical protein [Schaereria dolodes]
MPQSIWLGEELEGGGPGDERRWMDGCMNSRSEKEEESEGLTDNNNSSVEAGPTPEPDPQENLYNHSWIDLFAGAVGIGSPEDMAKEHATW